jgi:DeoD family purine-nucleoside phosphorylase
VNPAAQLAERVLLPGDPHRALAMAQSLLEAPVMFNHNRGLWGYTGVAPDGEPLTVQATGMGGPSAAVVVEELLDLGANTLVRVGTCGAFAAELDLGDLVVAHAALSADGASAALGASGLVEADERVTAALVEAGSPLDARRGVVATTDLFYDDRTELAAEWIAAGAVAVEMEAATIFRVAERRGAAAGCVLAVTDLLAGGDARGGRTRMERGEIGSAGIRAGQLALDAVVGLRRSGEEHDRRQGVRNR